MPTEFGFPYWARSLWGKQIIYDEDKLEEDDLEFLQSGYRSRNRQKVIFHGISFSLRWLKYFFSFKIREIDFPGASQEFFF